MTAPRVLIISGPIASGKSTVAHALARDLRVSGSTAAVVDLDSVYMMLDDTPLMSDPGTSRRARRAAAALVDQYVQDGIHLVIARGRLLDSQPAPGIHEPPLIRGGFGVRHAARERRGGFASGPVR